jgi:hypothetical protein
MMVVFHGFLNAFTKDWLADSFDSPFLKPRGSFDNVRNFSIKENLFNVNFSNNFEKTESMDIRP